MTQDDVLDIQGIDALLGRFRSRKMVQRELRNRTSDWGAENPNLLRPDLLAAMRLRFEAIAARSASEFSAVLRHRIEFKLESLDQQRFGPFIEKTPGASCLFRLDVNELGQPAYLITPELTVTSIIDLLLGGLGRQTALGRNLTTIEQRVLSNVMSPFLQVHQQSLSTITPLTIAWTGSFDSVDEIRPFAEAESCIVARYSASLDEDTQWDFVLALPFAELLPAIEAVASLPVQSEESVVGRRHALETRIADVQVDTSINVGSRELTLAEVTELEEGDVIVLDTKPGDAFTFLVEGVEKYRGTLGRKGSSMAFSITELANTTSSQPFTKGAQA
ncbi:MAG: FliM/FliN family flagellar motor switch protein [Planctomycetota bacterium]